MQAHGGWSWKMQNKPRNSSELERWQSFSQIRSCSRSTAGISVPWNAHGRVEAAADVPRRCWPAAAERGLSYKLRHRQAAMQVVDDTAIAVQYKYCNLIYGAECWRIQRGKRSCSGYSPRTVKSTLYVIFKLLKTLMFVFNVWSSFFQLLSPFRINFDSNVKHFLWDTMHISFGIQPPSITSFKYVWFLTKWVAAKVEKLNFIRCYHSMQGYLVE
jgi:hypothetical protein